MANTNLTDIHESFLQLVRLGIGHAESTEITDDLDWVALKALADSQGLSAVVLDGINKLNTNSTNGTKDLTVQQKLEWIGEVLQNYEQRYVQYEKAIGSLAGFYNQHGFKMMVLKGYACSQDWPKPNHRPCGDIDIWQFGQWREADATIAKEKGIKIDNGHHHHTVFNWQGFTVENHYDFVNVHAHKTGKEQEAIFKNLGHPSHIKDNQELENSRISTTSKNAKGTEIPCMVVNGEKVYLPSPNLHALFLIRHLANHFASMEITLRQVLDWAFFVEKHGKEIDWEWLEGVLDEFGMKELYNVFNAICVGDLGFDVHIFKQVQFDPDLKERVLKDMLSPEFASEMPRDVFKRIVWKWRRWKANEWKHQLVYKESMWSAFWSGVWGHLLKPKSI